MPKPQPFSKWPDDLPPLDGWKAVAERRMRERDDLMEALEDLVGRLKRNSLISEKDAYEYEPLIARIKGSG
jgi:hypothetical protein